MHIIMHTGGMAQSGCKPGWQMLLNTNLQLRTPAAATIAISSRHLLCKSPVEASSAAAADQITYFCLLPTQQLAPAAASHISSNCTYSQLLTTQ
jgi:hypothetical protein